MYEIRRKRNGSGGGSSRRKSRYGISSGELGSRLRHLKRRAAAKQGGGENDGESEGMPALAMSRRRDYDRGADAFWDGSLTDRSETDSVPSLANRIGFSSVTPRFKHMRKVDTPSPGTYTPRLDYMYSKRSSLGSNRTFGSSTSRFAKKKLGQMAFPGKFKPRGHVGSSTSRKAAPSAFIAASDSDDDGYHEPGPGFYDLGEHKKRYKGGASSMFTSRTRRILYRKPQDVPDPAAYDVPPGGINSVPWHASDTWQVCVCESV
jgi:hypothetical protein